MSSRPVTIRDLAAATGFSIATISLALRSHPRISEATREEIRRVSKELGYRANPMMAAHWETVRSRKSPTFQSVIAILTDWETSPKIAANPWIQPEFQSMSERAESLGYVTEEFSLASPEWSSARSPLKACLESLKSRGIYAIINLLPAHPKNLVRNSELFEEFATVAVCSESNYIEHSMRGLKRLPFHRANPDHYGNMLMLLEELRRLGYSRPGFWPNTWDEARFGGEATAAFNFWIQSLPPKDRIPVQWTKWKVDPPLSQVKEGFLKWLPRAQPDVVICQMYEVRKWMESSGLSIPREIGLAHTHLGPPEAGWTGIDSRLPEIASAAVDAVTSELQRNERGLPKIAKDVRIEGTWVPGKTTRVKPARKPRA